MNPSPFLPAKTQIGPYHLLEVLGEGGMGTVFLAEQRQPVVRRVALKVIKPGMDTKSVLARFDIERRALARMEHECIAKVFDAGATDRGQPWFAMEAVAGEPIGTFCDRHRLTVHQRIELFRRVCDGVQHAHQKGILHRDLKPANVLVADRDGSSEPKIPLPKIIDFGVAKATDPDSALATQYTEAGQFLGTPEYMSPEQASGDPDVDARTDVFSLGVLLYELLTGRLPFDSQALRRRGRDVQAAQPFDSPPLPSTRASIADDTSKAAAAARQLDELALPRSLRGDLDWILLKAIEADRLLRYQSVYELAADLDRHLRHEPVLACPPSLGYRVRKFVRKHRLVVTATAAVLVATLAFGITAFLQYLAAQASAREADRSAHVARINEERARRNEQIAMDRATENALLAQRESAAKQRAAIKVREFDLLSGVVHYQSAIANEKDLFPESPDLVPRLERWLTEHAERVVGHAQRCRADRARATQPRRATRGALRHERRCLAELPAGHVVGLAYQDGSTATAGTSSSAAPPQVVARSGRPDAEPSAGHAYLGRGARRHRAGRRQREQRTLPRRWDPTPIRGPTWSGADRHESGDQALGVLPPAQCLGWRR